MPLRLTGRSLRTCRPSFETGSLRRPLLLVIPAKAGIQYSLTAETHRRGGAMDPEPPLCSVPDDNGSNPSNKTTTQAD
ncbi:hypothetical protein IWQ48_002848 [Labrenzia sp. EL_13]|nr:hypothetical protein [Labrenzia sp. EL_195]MBG6201710.1 hypothetical protein [Labrenzia sp. EL_13]